MVIFHSMKKKYQIPPTGATSARLASFGNMSYIYLDAGFIQMLKARDLSRSSWRPGSKLVTGSVSTIGPFMAGIPLIIELYSRMLSSN